MHDTRDRAQRLAELLRREHGALADFLVALAAFDRERRWLELGYSSLFYFLHRELGLSKGAAFYRKTAAELIQRYPEVVEPLRDGRLPLARGGTSTVSNIRILCAFHNQLAARQAYGEAWMDRFTSKARSEAPISAQPSSSGLFSPASGEGRPR